MELTLAHLNQTEISVTCDGQHSHTFDSRTLLTNRDEKSPQSLDDPVAHGKAIYLALFPYGTAARHALQIMPERILLLCTDNKLDAVPWEYAYGPYGPESSEGFLVLDCLFVRGLPYSQRIEPPVLDSGLHIVAVPSNPMDQRIAPLDIEGEWERLKEVVQEVPAAITLERTRPPSLERLRRLLANQQQCIVHFMGHGNQLDSGAGLLFERENGALDVVTAQEFMRHLRGTVFLVTLNACVSASPGPTAFSNLAAALVQQKTPYALGMRSSITDEDARIFSRVFYSELARGTPVEEALRQARLALAKSPRPWTIGVPVLYSALTEPATGFSSPAGVPLIQEHQPSIEVSVLPRAEGTFQGRIDALQALGQLLTGDRRPPLVTIHGAGGQGKTALAREAVERFAYAWPAGVWATSLENLPSRELFVSGLARFLGLATQEGSEPEELERQVLARLRQRQLLIVLDNAETLIQAVEAQDPTALRLADLLREGLPRPPVSLLATSRSFLGLKYEVGLELGGLTPLEGTRLFWENAPRRRTEYSDQPPVWRLSERVEGHPLSLRLLGSAFNASPLSLSAFVEEYEAHLLTTENKYKTEDHRQRTLYASIETSVHYLDEDTRRLLSGLWVFHAPFLLETAIAIFGTEDQSDRERASPAYGHIHMLWQRGLLTHRSIAVGNERLWFYYLLPTMRPYLENHMEQAYERNQLLARFGAVHAHLVDFLYEELDKSATAVTIAQQAHENFERGLEHALDRRRGSYLLHWGWIQYRLGNPQYGLKLLEEALEIAQGRDQLLEFHALNNIASVYLATGRRKQALALFEQILSTENTVNDRAGEATTLANMGEVYRQTGQPQRALELYQRALPMVREAHFATGEVGILSSMAGIYQTRGQPQQALDLYEQALTLVRKVGDRTTEATILTNTANVYYMTGQSKRALELFEQALPIRREMGDRIGEALTLTNMGEVYRASGQLELALKLYERALPIVREVQSLADEASVLNNIAGIYYEQGQLRQALELDEQILLIRREVEDRAGEAQTLDNMAVMYYALGQPRQSLELYEQVLPLRREVGDRYGEALTLTNMGGVYQSIGQLKRALELYEQALSIRREVSDRAGEADTLSRTASVHKELGRTAQALDLYEQAQLIYHQLNNRAGEGDTLANIGTIHLALGRPRQALEMYQQALSIQHELNDRMGEATVLNNMAVVHKNLGQLEQALELYERALAIQRELGNRAGEAATLTNMGVTYKTIGQPQRALALLEQALPIMRDVENPAGEAAVLENLASVLYESLNRPSEAIAWQKQAIAVLIETDLFQDAAGLTLDDLRRILEAMQRGEPAVGSTALSAAQIQQIVTTTVTAVTGTRYQRIEWREEIAEHLEHAQQHASDWPKEVDFFSAILALLDGQPAALPGEHPYSQAIATIQASIPAGSLPSIQLISPSIAALRGDPQEKMRYMQYLDALGAETTDGELKSLIQSIKLALVGGDLSLLGRDLTGIYRQAWEAITDGAKTSPEEGNKKRIIRVGKPYIQGETSQEEGVQYSWDPISHVLVFFFRNPQPHEVQAIKSGEAEFALVVKQDIIFLLSHFKGVRQGQQGTDWSDAPYTWHLLPDELRRLPPAPEGLQPEEQAKLVIVLVNGDNGIVLVIRRVRLSQEFTARLYQAIRDQASKPFDPDAYKRQLERLYAMYPDAKFLLPHALVRCKGVDEAWS